MTGVDYISRMPDSLLHEILSVLTTKEVVRSTSTLSKRWEHLWMHSPSLKFDSNEFRDDTKFVEFVDFVFAQRQMLNLDEFRLSWDNRTSTFEAAERWLTQVVDTKPRVLVLNTSSATHYLEISDDVFVCESIEELNLSTSFFRGSYSLKPKLVNLECLKKLQIKGRISLDEEFMRKLMSGSPAIEELLLCCSLSTISSKSMDFKCLKKLTIKGDVNLDDNFMEKLMHGSPVLQELLLDCNYKGLHTISSQSLKHMEIFCCERDEFEISIPSLLNLYMEGAIAGRISCTNMTSLVDVHIWVEGCMYDGQATLLSGFSNAEKLHFDLVYTMDMFEEELPNCPMFNNLKEMNCQVTSFYPIAWFLQHAPGLENLTLRYLMGCDSYMHEEKYRERDIFFSCKNLRTVEICYASPKEACDAKKLLSYSIDMPDDVEITFTRL